MIQLSPIVNVAGGSTFVKDVGTPPACVTVIVYNRTAFILTVTMAGNTITIQPFTADRFDVGQIVGGGGAVQISTSATAGGGLAAGGSISFSVYGTGEQVIGAFPQPLTPSALQQRVVAVPTSVGKDPGAIINAGVSIPGVGSSVDLFSQTGLSGLGSALTPTFVPFYIFSLAITLGYISAAGAGGMDLSLKIDLRNGGVSQGGVWPFEFWRGYLTWAGSTGPFPHVIYDWSVPKLVSGIIAAATDRWVLMATDNAALNIPTTMIISTSIVPDFVNLSNNNIFPAFSGPIGHPSNGLRNDGTSAIY